MSSSFGIQSSELTAVPLPSGFEKSFAACREDLLFLGLAAADRAATVVRHYFESQFQTGNELNERQFELPLRIASSKNLTMTTVVASYEILP